MKIRPLFLVLVVFIIVGCNRKLLLPLNNAVLEKVSNNPLNYDVSFFIYANSSSNVLASEDCEITMVQKIESSYYILAKGKYEVAYGMLSESSIKVGEKVKRGQVIGKLKNEQKIDTINISYLIVTIKDSKGHFVSAYNVFK